MSVPLRHDLVGDLVQADPGRDGHEGADEPEAEEEGELTRRDQSSRGRVVRDREGGAEGEDRDPELEDLLAAESDAGARPRLIPINVDRRGRAVPGRSARYARDEGFVF